MPAEQIANRSDVLSGSNRPARWRDALAAIRADHDAIRRYRQKYEGGGEVSRYLLVDLIRKIGFQMMTAYRLMRLARAMRIPLLPQIVSRVCRHLYGADIHWDAQFEPGVLIVHGMGMCISHGAIVDSGAILFQGVTLGEAMSPDSRVVGSPRVGRDVHIGPGATLLGPISIGAGSKIMAGCVVTQSVPPGSIVEACKPVVRARGSRTAVSE